MHSLLVSASIAALLVGGFCSIKARRVPREARDQREYLKWSGIGDILVLLGGGYLLVFA